MCSHLLKEFFQTKGHQKIDGVVLACDEQTCRCGIGDSSRVKTRRLNAACQFPLPLIIPDDYCSSPNRAYFNESNWSTNQFRSQLANHDPAKRL